MLFNTPQVGGQLEFQREIPKNLVRKWKNYDKMKQDELDAWQRKTCETPASSD
jgi:hypothetical protein